MMNYKNILKVINKAGVLVIAFLALTASGSIIGCGDSSAEVGLSDTTVPTVNSTTPADDDTDVAFNRSLTATFSEEMTDLTVTSSTFTVTGPSLTPVTGTVALDATNKIATFTPTGNLAPNTTYTVTLTTGVQDLAFNGLASNYVFTFTTGATADSVAPSVSLTSPVDAATGVAINASINATLSEEITASTVTTSTFLLTDSGAHSVSGTVSFNAENLIATFVPDSDLDANTLYTATLTTGIQDLAGLALATNYVWSFTTGTTAAEDAVALGSANNFAVLAGSTVTNTGLTTINGDLGVSPGTAVTGFLPGILNGTQHAGDTTAAQAILDLTTAYNDAAGRSTAPITVSGNLGGQTLTPGLYKSTSSLEITSGNLTLDANGDANGIFIFQMASTFTSSAGLQVILSGGAKANNIYWQVGSSATLGINSIFKGNIMADQSITLTTGAVLEGRALTRIGAVTLDANTVTAPAN